MGFKKGNKFSAHGGAIPGAGRNPDWLKIHCAEIINKYHLADFLGKVASGDEYEMRDRLKCIEILLDRGFGKSIQPVMPSDKDGQYQPYSITVKIDNGGKK